jgi:hypothetical protein
VEKNDGSDPFDGEPGPRLRGATRSAKKGLLAHVLIALLKNQKLTIDELIEHSSPDGEHFIDRNFLRKILRAESFPDYDTFVNIVDGLIELQALHLLFIKRLEYVYAEECVAWDRVYRETSGRVSETRRTRDRVEKGTERTEETYAAESSNKAEENEGGREIPVGERGFEPLIG